MCSAAHRLGITHTVGGIKDFFRFVSVSTGNRGRAIVTAGIVLPSKVTSLVIQKPTKFNFTPGDWVFVKIPQIAIFEWHPFTISSAPEQKVKLCF